MTLKNHYDHPQIPDAVTGIIDHKTITGQGDRCHDGTTWQPDLTITYHRTT